MVLLSILLLPLFVSYGQAFSPPCQWHSYTHGNLIEPIGMCGYTSQFGTPAYAQYYCVGTAELYWGVFLDSNCTDTAYQEIKYDHQFNCDLPLCSVNGGSDYNIAHFEEHYDEDNSTKYYDQFYLVFASDVCFVGQSEFFTVNIYNDSAISPSFGGETLYYYEEQCMEQKEYCDVWTDSELVSYTGTPTKLKTCYSVDGCRNKKPQAFTCSWVAHDGDPCWWEALDICDTSRGIDDHGNICSDHQLKCNDNHTIVSYYIYDSADGSCSGNLVDTIFYTNDTYSFDCSLPTCVDVVKFRRYDLFNCGDKECGSDGCNLEENVYGTYNWLLPGFCDDYPCLEVEKYCDDEYNNGTYPDNSVFHGQWFEIVGFNASSVLDSKRSMCWTNSPTTDTPTTGSPTTATPTTATDAPTTDAPTTDAPTTNTPTTGTPTTGSPTTDTPTTNTPTTSTPTTGAPTTDEPTTNAPTEMAVTGENGVNKHHTFGIFGVTMFVTVSSLM